MKTLFFSPLALALALLGGGAAHAVDVVLVDENFESYGVSADVTTKWTPVGAGAWQLVDETYQEFISLDDTSPRNIGAAAFPGGGQGVEHRGLGVLEINVANLNGGQPLVATAEKSIVLQGDIFDVGPTGNKRMSIGLRNTSPSANLIEMGQNNGNNIGFAHRAALFPVSGGATNPDWQYFTLPSVLDRTTDLDEIVSVGDVGQAWSTYKVTITNTNMTFQIDAKRDGLDAATGLPGWDATVSYDLVSSATGFNSLRFGSPSGISSGGNGFYGGMIFDNLKLSLITPIVEPEPLVGDFNGDGFVNAADYTVWRDTLNASVTPGTGADANGNGVIDGPGAGTDYALWASNYGASQGAAASLTIPEPTSLVLAALGLMAARRRR